MAGAAPCDGGSEEESRYDGQRAFHCSMYTTRESALSRTDAQGSFRNTGPGERVAPRSESLSLDALDEEVVPVLNTLIHVYVRMLIAWRKSSVSPSMKRGLPDARPHS
jgi:hypothetical protein